MKNRVKKYINQINLILSKSRWQLIIAISLSIAYLLGGQYLLPLDENGKRQLMIFMAMLGSILALITSLSFGFLIQYMNTTNNRKHDLFTKLKSGLFNFDLFLKDYPQNLPIIYESESFSWELKSIRFEELPIVDWDERLEELRPHIEESRGAYEEDRNLENKILGYLVIIEEIISDIGLMCIKQIIFDIHVKRVIKGFLCLAGVLATTVITFYTRSESFLYFLSTAPIFFSIMVLLYILELGTQLKRESAEELIFIESNQTPE